MTVTLLVMRLEDMQRVHPDQATHRCSQCREEVGVFPSGQRVMRSMSTKLICTRCKPFDKGAELAPGAETEVFESVKKK